MQTLRWKAVHKATPYPCIKCRHTGHVGEFWSGSGDGPLSRSSRGETNDHNHCKCCQNSSMLRRRAKHLLRNTGCRLLGAVDSTYSPWMAEASAETLHAEASLCLASIIAPTWAKETRACKPPPPGKARLCRKCIVSGAPGPPQLVAHVGENLSLKTLNPKP